MSLAVELSFYLKTAGAIKMLKRNYFSARTLHQILIFSVCLDLEFITPFWNIKHFMLVYMWMLEDWSYVCIPSITQTYDQWIAHVLCDWSRHGVWFGSNVSGYDKAGTMSDFNINKTCWGNAKLNTLALSSMDLWGSHQLPSESGFFLLCLGL